MCGVQDLYVLMVTITTMIELYTGRFFYCLKRKNIVCGQKLVPLKNNMRQIKSRVRHVPYAFHCHLKLKTERYPLFISVISDVDPNIERRNIHKCFIL